MKAKTKQSREFIEELHKAIVGDAQFRRDTGRLSERAVQREIRPLIITYLEDYYRRKGIKDPRRMANASFYWESAEQTGELRDTVFGGRNYPDFIITKPYRIAIEYKQSPNGSTVKQGIGQSIMHTLSEFKKGPDKGKSHFDFVYYLFHDESQNQRIWNSRNGTNEAKIITKLEDDFNVFVRFVNSKDKK
jgi:hypothetical protein